MSCKHGFTEELIYDFVAGNLDVVFAKRVEKHLKVCDDCQSIYHTWVEIYEGNTSVVKGQPPTSVKKRVMGTVRKERSRVSFLKQPAFLFLSVGVTIVFLLIGVTLGQTTSYELSDGDEGLDGVHGGGIEVTEGLGGLPAEREDVEFSATARSELEYKEQMESLQPFLVKEETNVYEILPEYNENIKGYVWINQDSNELMLFVDGLPPVALKDYQGWVQTANEVKNAGVIKTSGETGLVYYQDRSIKTLEHIMLSREPLGGSDELTDPNPVFIQLNSR
ncbi:MULTISPECIES: anti-sigma factor [Bacillaceae]|uniref:Anti-sigma factor n=1 Tax=Evansella alkalicola TaxID=745819 RepID=A0ABS6JWH0_9BACI|nr:MULTISPECIES: anti-sigma factor [Bacillaceae]MBU9722942.1 anti-sigma factor [Bacillus alkalicola]